MTNYMMCETCKFADRNEYGVFEDRCSGYANCAYEEYSGDIGMKLSIDSLYDLRFGSFVRVMWSKNEECRGVIYGSNIGYEDGKTEAVSIIAEHMSRDLCKVFLIGEF